MDLKDIPVAAIALKSTYKNDVCDIGSDKYIEFFKKFAKVFNEAVSRSIVDLDLIIVVRFNSSDINICTT